MSIYKALVSGGTGFVGANLARRLVRDGWQVHIITIPNDKLDHIADIAGRVTLHVHDGSTEGMDEILASTQPDLVFHLASLFLSEHTMADISRLVQSNVLFGTQLLEAMATHGITKIVNTGTSWQHYENKAYSPVNLYAATKQAFEDLLQYYVEAKGIFSVTLKLFDTYGPNDPRPKLFHLLEKTVREDSTLAMSSGEQMLDLVYIDDVVQAFVVAAQRLLGNTVNGHERYAVSSGKRIKLRDLVDLYRRVACRELHILWGHRPYRLREVMVPWDKGAVLPEWQPKTTLEDGLRLINKRRRGDP